MIFPSARFCISSVPRRAFVVQPLSVIIIDENLAKKGLSNITDYLFRDPESIKRFYVLIAKDIKAEKIIKVLSPLTNPRRYKI